MIKYHKIQTVFKRNPYTKFRTLINGDYSLPEFEYLKDNQWIFTEKVDGTNIRIMWNEHYDHPPIEFRGKSDKAQMPPVLEKALPELFSIEKLESVFGNVTSACLYGEGYGPKIQSGGKYRKDASFVLFDIKIDEWWLKREDVEGVAMGLGVDVVPIIGTGSLKSMVELASSGFKSSWGDFEAEGIVARPKVELKCRTGERIITKVKAKDFR